MIYSKRFRNFFRNIYIYTITINKIKNNSFKKISESKMMRLGPPFFIFLNILGSFEAILYLFSVTDEERRAGEGGRWASERGLHNVE